MDVVKLLTLLNSSAARPSALKRKRRDDATDWLAAVKRSKISSTSAQLLVEQHPAPSPAIRHQDSPESALRRFSAETVSLQDAYIAAVDAGQRRSTEHALDGLGVVVEYLPSPAGAPPAECQVRAQHRHCGVRLSTSVQHLPKLVDQLEQSGLRTAEQKAFSSLLRTYQDILVASRTLERSGLQAETALHAMNHVVRGQRLVLSNNDALARAKDSQPAPILDRELRDQGFTRPKVLILTPFRNGVLSWASHLMRVSPSPQVENEKRLRTEYSLPEGVIDRLAEPDAHLRYPKDHVETFRGNIDDSFRLGIKVSRKSLKLFSEFYASDIIIASPLGLRKSIDTTGDADYLSSIEITIVDQADVLLMQNWDHVQHIFSRLNLIPSDPHGCDFARVKAWYLDNKAAYLRQTITLSAFETPELRAMASRQSRNVSGSIILATTGPPAASALPAGVKQIYHRFDAALSNLDDARFEAFVSRILPILVKSAVMSSHTLIFVPSYFDFVRLRAHMKQLADLDVAAISEYTVNSDAIRSRAFFKSGRKSFLLVTERFHFYRRYRLQGARTIVFYDLPEHSDYYAELIGQSAGEAGDGAEIAVHALFSPPDALKLGRILGKNNARRLCSGEEGSSIESSSAATTTTTTTTHRPACSQCCRIAVSASQQARVHHRSMASSPLWDSGVSLVIQPLPVLWSSERVQYEVKRRLAAASTCSLSQIGRHSLNCRVQKCASTSATDTVRGVSVLVFDSRAVVHFRSVKAARCGFQALAARPLCADGNRLGATSDMKQNDLASSCLEHRLQVRDELKLLSRYETPAQSLRVALLQRRRAVRPAQRLEDTPLTSTLLDDDIDGAQIPKSALPQRRHLAVGDLDGVPLTSRHALFCRPASSPTGLCPLPTARIEDLLFTPASAFHLQPLSPPARAKLFLASRGGPCPYKSSM